MKDHAPQVFRQRLLLEGLYTIEVTRSAVEDYLTGLAAHLELKAYGQPTIHSPGGLGSVQNQGFDAFLPLIDSGIAAYVWSSARLFSIVLYTCKGFDDERAIAFTRTYFAASAVESMRF